MNIFVPLYVLILLVCAYIIFPRQINNAITRVLKRKQFVVCYMIRANTDFIEKYLVVPSLDKLTTVARKGDYNLDEQFSDNKTKGRLHFILHEGDSIPKKFKDQEERYAFYGKKAYKVKISFSFPNNKEILFQAKSVHNALNNNIAEFLFTRKKDIYFIILLVVVAILAVALIYDAYVLQRTNQILEYFASTGQTSQLK